MTWMVQEFCMLPGSAQLVNHWDKPRLNRLTQSQNVIFVYISGWLQHLRNMFMLQKGGRF